MRSVSVLIPWQNRSELSMMLIKNSSWFRYFALEVIVVNFFGNKKMFQEASNTFCNSHIRFYELDGDKPFNKSLCLNLALSLSSGDFVFCLDTDVVLGRQTLELAMEHIASGNCYVTIKSVVESNPELRRHSETPDGKISAVESTLRIELDDGRAATTRHILNANGSRSGPGLLLVEQEHLHKVKGWNSALTGWGFEDADVQLRLQFALALQHVQVGSALHLSHPLVERSKRNATNNRLFARRLYEKGIFLGSYSSDISQYADHLREVHPTF
jgi:predicted glycosyltransferase involved in capsule biosynthesis